MSPSCPSATTVTSLQATDTIWFPAFASRDVSSRCKEIRTHSILFLSFARVVACARIHNSSLYSCFSFPLCNRSWGWSQLCRPTVFPCAICGCIVVLAGVHVVTPKPLLFMQLSWILCYVCVAAAVSSHGCISLHPHPRVSQGEFPTNNCLQDLAW